MTASVKSETVTGETVILSYKKHTAVGIATYQKLCKTIDNIENWLPEAVTQFLEQFVNIGHLLDAQCKLLVEKLASISWHVVPADIRFRFVKMLRELAVHYVCHTETVLCCFVANLLPKVRPVITSKDSLSDDGVCDNSPKFEAILSEEEQRKVYELAHEGIQFILRCFPMTVRLLEKAVRRTFPHFSAPLLRYESFVQNIFFVMDYAVDARPELWKLLFENLVPLDSLVSKGVALRIETEKEEKSNNNFGVFLMDEESDRATSSTNADNKEREEKLDICLCYVLSYISRVHNIDNLSEIAILTAALPNISTVCKDGLYLNLRTAFEAHVLSAPGLKCMPFVLFYLLSLNQKYVVNFVEWLWSFVVSPSRSPNDWKKAHAAACYLGSFLSRAKYVNFKFCLRWMERLIKWCNQYVNETVCESAASATAGTLRHGAFYAVCQALLVVFSFRHNEIVRENELENFQRLGLGHIIHSSLQPLRYINHAVALNFATISRTLQLVYCSHILPQNFDEVNVPFEPFFPFEYCFLSRFSMFFRDLTLRFSPLREDVVVSEVTWSSSKCSGAMSFVDQHENGSLDFLEDLKRDRETINDQKYGVWPLIGSPRFGYSISKFSVSPVSTSFVASSSIMDTD